MFVNLKRKMSVITDTNILNVRKFVKNNILNNDKFTGHEEERENILNLLKQTIEAGESNSALLIGPRSSGKTTVSPLPHVFLNSSQILS